MRKPPPMHAIDLTAPADRTEPVPIPGARHRAAPRTRRRSRWDRAPHLLAFALFAAYTTHSVLRYHRMQTRSWDLGIFEQAIRAYAQLEAPVVDLKGPGTNILGDHFSPVTALIAPAYRLFPTPVTLLVAQAALFAIAAIPVTRAATRLLGRASGLAIGVAYGLSWGIQQAVDFDFHEICFAVPLIAFSLESLMRRRWRAALLWAAPLVLVKEDLGVTLAAIALVVAWRARRERFRVTLYALGVAAFGLIATAVTLTVLIPAFNNTGVYGYWEKVDGGPSPFGGADVKLRTVAWLLLPTGLLAVRSPLVLAGVPTLGWRFLSGEEHYWSTDWHYSAVLMPVLFLALVDAVATSRRSPRPWLRAYADRLPACAAAAALALTTAQPLSALTESAAYHKPSRATAAENLLARIPDGATVESDVGALSRLAGRCRVLWVGDSRGVTPDWIALDNNSGWVEDPLAYARRLHPKATYRLSGAAGGYLLLARVDRR
ncbi:DUF2079 domain-containing protein [Streptomyces sp. NPDC006475]|uniref:DUF2079 domain-containing protein n=1 Tax=Streptomyces sp. NPDC006475 TaxID=3155719 RepID=UPI0033A98A9F